MDRAVHPGLVDGGLCPLLAHHRLQNLQEDSEDTTEEVANAGEGGAADQ